MKRAALLVAAALVVQAQPDRVALLATGVERAEAVRAVKRLQQAYNQYLDAGQWNELDALVTADVKADFPAPGERSGTVLDKAGLHRYWMQEAKRAANGLADGQLNTHLILQPIVNLGPDGRTAQGTWHQISMLGQFGESATWTGGIYENEYALDGGVWKIRKVHYSEQYRGAYEDAGQKAPPKWEIPYHFTPEHLGVTIPPSALQAAAKVPSLGNLTARLQQLEDETAVLNLQNTYGYYMERKMWDDVADLFGSGGAQMRKDLEARFGAPKLKTGELWEHVNFGTVVTIARDGRSANARSVELRQLGQLNEYQRWELGTYENEFVKESGVWRFKAVHYSPRWIGNYEDGWAKTKPLTNFQAFHYKNLGRPVEPPSAGPAKSVEVLERMLAQAIGYDATENQMSAYGYYLDESAWDSLVESCASNCVFELSDVGIYLGKERARRALKLRYPNNGRGPNSYTIHQLLQPVIHVAEDGKTAHARMRLFQMGGAASGASGAWIGGTYENQAFFEDGEWKFGVKDLQHQFSATYRNGWAKIAPRAANVKAAPKADTKAKAPTGLAAFPPDRPQRTRQYPFPEILEPAFHYKNPVSGRVPPVYLP